MFEGGVATLWAEGHGERVSLRPGLEARAAVRAARALATLVERPARLRRVRRLEVTVINGEPARAARPREAFLAAGHTLTRAGLRWRPAAT